MEKKDKPRLAEVLGVEEDEEWTFSGTGPYRIHSGLRQYKASNGFWVEGQNEALLAMMITHPENIIRAPRLTEAELERCRVYGAKWVSRDNYMARFELWRTKPEYKNGNYYSQANKGGLIAAIFDDSLFQSVRPGDCICVEEAQHDD